MPKVEIPADLQGQFVSKIPSPTAMELSGVTNWGASYMQNAAYFAQFSVSRLYQRADTNIPAIAQKMLQIVPTVQQGAQVWRNADNPAGALADLGDISFAVMEQAMNIIGAVGEAVPVINIVAKVGLAVQRIFWKKWFESIQPQPAPVGLRYDWATDNSVQREMASMISGGNIVEVFLPRVNFRTSGGDIELRKVQDLTVSKDRDWMVIPQGDVLGLGCLPGGMGIPWSWQEFSQWSDFSPGSLSASIVAWGLASGEFGLTKAEKAYIKSEWVLFYGYVAKKADELDAKYDSTGKRTYGRQRNVLLNALRPIKPTPLTLPTDPDEAQKAMEGVGDPMWGTGAHGIGPTMAQAVAVQIDTMKKRAKSVVFREVPPSRKLPPPPSRQSSYKVGQLPSSGGGEMLLLGGAAAATYFFFR